MPRGRKRTKGLTFEEQIDQINQRIKEEEETIRSLKDQRKGLKQKYEDDERNALISAVKASGRTFDEIESE